MQEQIDPMCQKMTLQGDRPGWQNREFCLELGKQDKSLWPLEKGPGLRRTVRMLWGYAERKFRSQLELNLVSSAKDNKECFYLSIINKRSAKRNSIFYWEGGRKRVKKDKKKLRCLMPSCFTLQWQNKMSLGTWALRWNTGMRSREKTM